MAEERVQRRLAAILAADVAGYSRLRVEDESGRLRLTILNAAVMIRAFHSRLSLPS